METDSKWKTTISWLFLFVTDLPIHNQLNSKMSSSSMAEFISSDESNSSLDSIGCLNSSSSNSVPLHITLFLDDEPNRVSVQKKLILNAFPFWTVDTVIRACLQKAHVDGDPLTFGMSNSKRNPSLNPSTRLCDIEFHEKVSI